MAEGRCPQLTESIPGGQRGKQHPPGQVRAVASGRVINGYLGSDWVCASPAPRKVLNTAVVERHRSPIGCGNPFKHRMAKQCRTRPPQALLADQEGVDQLTIVSQHSSTPRGPGLPLSLPRVGSRPPPHRTCMQSHRSEGLLPVHLKACPWPACQKWRPICQGGLLPRCSLRAVCSTA